MPFTKTLGTVSTSDIEIKTGSVCDSVSVFEDAQAGTTDFKFKSNGSSDFVTYPSGKAMILTRAKGYWEKNTTLGYIQRVGADATFVQIETP